MGVRAPLRDDWPALRTIWHAVVAAGDSYVWPPDTSEEAAQKL